MSFIAELSEPFPKEVERVLKKGGRSFTYIPVSEVITRLNKVLGIESWSYEVLSVGRDDLDPDFIVAHVRLSVIFEADEGDGETSTSLTVRDGVGGIKVKRTHKGDIIDLGDDMKGAVSDALKKAAQHFGVGLYLARGEEALYLEEAEAPTNPPISESHFMRLNNIMAELPEDILVQAQAFWDAVSNGAPFEREFVTRSLLDEMLKFLKTIRDNQYAVQS